MSITLFITMFTVGAAAAALLTEAVKKFYANAGKECSPNVVALVDAVVIGAGGTAVVYMLMDISWTVNNIICLMLMAGCVWIGSMIGYDKVVQLLKQIEAKEK